MREVAWILGVVLTLSSCIDELPEASQSFGVLEQAAIDCSERTDTGYVRGSAFPITVVTVDGKPVERETANAYYVMQQAAAAAGVSVRIVSGFRTMSEQQYLYNCYINCNCNNCNLAARPGYSNHQSGHALDLNTSNGSVYTWLSNNASRYGFSRTVPGEPWHWEWWGGGPGGGPCGGCVPGCKNDRIIVDRNCGEGDCGAFGSRCVDDSLGPRCVFAFCPEQGETTVCLDESTIGTCRNGQIETGDCGAFGAYCSTAGANAARCVSVFCVESADEVPRAKTGCFLDGQVFSCDSNGAISLSPCPGGQTCVAFPEPHCDAPPPCPASGNATICLEDTVVGHCTDGVVTEASDCAGLDTSGICSVVDGQARCVAPECVNAPGATLCLTEGTLGRCSATGQLESEVCGEGEVCGMAAGEARCASKLCVESGEIVGRGGCTESGEVFACDDLGAATQTPCASDQLCEVGDGLGQCEALPECVSREEGRWCDGNTVVECSGGETVFAADCASRDGVCLEIGPQGAGCVSTLCASAGELPRDESRCLGEREWVRCVSDGRHEVETCQLGQQCEVVDGEAQCLSLGTTVEPDVSEPAPDLQPVDNCSCALRSQRGGSGLGWGVLGLLVFWRRRRS